jgi:uncharacterized membrane protein (UPF0127 family)
MSSEPSQTAMPHVVIGSVTIPVEVVSTAADIDKGLSGRKSLEASQGMLFLFDHSALFKFWMRGMRFSIDILWINEEYMIVDISENLPQVPFLKRPVFYSPSVPARYVLEVNASFSRAHGIRPGDRVTFVSVPL